MSDFPARRRRLAALAAARGLDGVLVFSWRRAAVAWCCGYTPGFATNWAALWIGRDGDATLGVRFPFELERAARESGLPCVEAPLPIAVVPLAARTIGIVAGDVAIDELPQEVAAELVRCGIAHERLDDELNAWRAVKSPAEVAALKRAAAICSAALWAGAPTTRWGDDFGLAAAVEAVCRERGATRALCLVGAGDGAVVTEPYGAKLPLGEPIGVELTIQLPDGSGHVCHTYAEGRAAQRCAAARTACERARAAIFATIAPGTPVDAVVAAGEAELARHGLLGSREYDFGHGIGLETPERPRLLAGLGERIAVGQVIAVHVGVRNGALGTWVTGGPVLVGDDGARELLRGAPWSAPDAAADARTIPDAAPAADPRTAPDAAADARTAPDPAATAPPAPRPRVTAATR